MQILSGEQLIFFPGLDGTGISYEPLSEFVATDTEVIIVRYPKAKVQDFHEIVECADGQISSANDAVVIAESFSGPIAIELIASGRLRAKCLILCATFARSPRPFLLNVAKYLPLSTILGLHLPDTILKLVLGGSEFSDSLLPIFHRMKDKVLPKVLAQRLKIVSCVDVRQWLSKLSIPCCYIQATADIAVPSSAISDFTDNISNLNVKNIRGPHFIIQARPKETAEVIEEFNNLTTKKSSGAQTAAPAY